MSFIISIFNAICYTFTVYNAVVFIVYLISKIKGHTHKEVMEYDLNAKAKDDYYQKHLIFFTIVSISFGIFFNPLTQHFSEFHSIYLEPVGEYSYYVEYYDYDTKQTTTVPALISVEFSIPKNDYHLEKIILPNGKIQDQYSEPAISFNELTEIYDDNAFTLGDARLTNKHLYHNNLTESSKLTVTNIIITFLYLIIHFFALYYFMYPFKKEV